MHNIRKAANFLINRGNLELFIVIALIDSIFKNAENKIFAFCIILCYYKITIRYRRCHK